MEAKTTHTPGPWRVEIAGTRGLYRVFIPTEHELAAAETDGMDGGSVTRANAALIAAAPELYEAPRPFVDALNEHEDRIRQFNLGPLHVDDYAVITWPNGEQKIVPIAAFIEARSALSRVEQTDEVGND